MGVSKALLATIFFLYLTTNIVSKIVLPLKLRYLENMLNADVVAKAAKIRQRIEENPNIQDNEKSWPMILAKYQANESLYKNNFKNNMPPYAYNSIYSRRLPNYM
ncbi:hypothetical protein K1T71_000528 [Dendrolimus kikuchii]|uniref:Uncharacterized protein n=1 Tax=Dendrolimus kikuchii TaxID=765133 RepID=A0ACC1DJZ0_9NEOP|nr:hypothetical protein K1T71_000528 [Dendrolimus kikuchii]